MMTEALLLINRFLSDCKDEDDNGVFAAAPDGGDLCADNRNECRLCLVSLLGRPLPLPADDGVTFLPSNITSTKSVSFSVISVS